MPGEPVGSRIYSDTLAWRWGAPQALAWRIACPVSEPRHIAPTGPAERAGCPNISASHYRH
jgi:hypothetical protein